MNKEHAMTKEELKKALSKVPIIGIDVDMVDAWRATVYEKKPEDPRHVKLGYNPRVAYYYTTASATREEAIKKGNKYIRKSGSSSEYVAIPGKIKAYAARVEKGKKVVHRTEPFDYPGEAVSAATKWTRQNYREFIALATRPK